MSFHHCKALLTYIHLAPSDFDHYQEDPEFENGGTGIEEDTVMDQRDQIEEDTVMDQRDRNMRDMSLRDSHTAGTS